MLDARNLPKKLFLSYSWNDSKIADQIDSELCALGFNVIRDIRYIGDRDSIKSFMRSIRDQDYAIAIISPNYLKSQNCMFEIAELMRDLQFKDKIFSIVTEDADIYNPISRARYVKYWEDETKKLEDAIRPLRLENISELSNDLKQYRTIEMNIASFLDFISDTNNPKITCAVDKIKEYLLKDKINILSSSNGKYAGGIELRLEACHYVFSFVDQEQNIVIRKVNADFTPQNCLVKEIFPMLMLSVTNHSTKRRIFKAPIIEYAFKSNGSEDIRIDAEPFISTHTKNIEIEPGVNIFFPSYGLQIYLKILFLCENIIKEIYIEESDARYMVPFHQIEIAANYFKKHYSKTDLASGKIYYQHIPHKSLFMINPVFQNFN